MTLAQLQQTLAAASPDDPQAAVRLVDALLAASAEAGASDVHLLPTAEGLAISWRIDGVLQPVGRAPRELAANVVTRLKVLARLLTYRTNVPQEGRIAASDGAAVEVRISTFPTLFGEKVVARNLPRGRRPLARIADLGLPDEVARSLRAALVQTSGALVIAGPAGSGKTTTAYACLREIVDSPRPARSIASLEDPIEVVVDGVAQSQVAEAAGFDLLTGLRSLVRQDPEVIFLGEIRDADAAAVAMQAALSGQLLVTTFHATDAAAALGRLAEMGVAPYALRSGVRAVVAQRLVRRLCRCSQPLDATAAASAAAALGLARLGLAADTLRHPVGCEVCRGAGYAGRMAVAEVLELDAPAVAEAVLARRDAPALRAAAESAGMTALAPRTAELVSAGLTSPEEALRVFGIDG